MSTSKIFTVGDLTKTDDRLAVAIAGDGFLKSRCPTTNEATPGMARGKSTKTAASSPTTAWCCRAVSARFHRRTQGHHHLEKRHGHDFRFERHGRLTSRSPGSSIPSGLKPIGGNLYTETEGSGRPETGTPGENSFGTLNKATGNVERQGRGRNGEPHPRANARTK